MAVNPALTAIEQQFPLPGDDTGPGGLGYDPVIHEDVVANHGVDLGQLDNTELERPPVSGLGQGEQLGSPQPRPWWQRYTKYGLGGAALRLAVRLTPLTELSTTTLGSTVAGGTSLGVGAAVATVASLGIGVGLFDYGFYLSQPCQYPQGDAPCGAEPEVIERLPSLDPLLLDRSAFGDPFTETRRPLEINRFDRKSQPQLWEGWEREHGFLVPDHALGSGPYEFVGSAEDRKPADSSFTYGEIIDRLERALADPKGRPVATDEVLEEMVGETSAYETPFLEGLSVALDARADSLDPILDAERIRRLRMEAADRMPVGYGTEEEMERRFRWGPTIGMLLGKPYADAPLAILSGRPSASAARVEVLWDLDHALQTSKLPTLAVAQEVGFAHSFSRLPPIFGELASLTPDEVRTLDGLIKTNRKTDGEFQ